MRRAWPIMSREVRPFFRQNMRETDLRKGTKPNDSAKYVGYRSRESGIARIRVFAQRRLQRQRRVTRRK